MRAAEFRKDPALVSQWKDMLEKHELLKLVLNVMNEEHPTRFIVKRDTGGDISPTMASLELGETRGYSMYANSLRMLANPLNTPQPLPNTSYEPEEPESQSPTPQPKRRGRPPKNK